MSYINVMDGFGVYGDGCHDDTCALQSCIDSLRDGGTIYFPDGIYLISATLIFYSHQSFKLSDGAIIRRRSDSTPVTRYLMASYSEPTWGGYEGTHDVTISGGVFDGNESLQEKTTLLNTVHCRNITIDGCRFIHCAHWHCIEINSTQNATIQNCTFDGESYTFVPSNIYNEQIQMDMAKDGSYGPVYNCNAQLIDFCKDMTVCTDIKIQGNTFICDGFPAIGHHDPCDHHHIKIHDNIFRGPMCRDGRCRGYIILKKPVYDVQITGNSFLAPKIADSSAVCIIAENTDTSLISEKDNTYTGYFSKIRSSEEI